MTRDKLRALLEQGENLEHGEGAYTALAYRSTGDIYCLVLSGYDGDNEDVTLQVRGVETLLDRMAKIVPLDKWEVEP